MKRKISFILIVMTMMSFMACSKKDEKGEDVVSNNIQSENTVSDEKKNTNEETKKVEVTKIVNIYSGKDVVLKWEGLQPTDPNFNVDIHKNYITITNNSNKEIVQFKVNKTYQFGSPLTLTENVKENYIHTFNEVIGVGETKVVTIEGRPLTPDDAYGCSLESVKFKE